MPQVAPAAAPATAPAAAGRSRDGPSAERGRRDSRRDGRPPAARWSTSSRPAPRSCRPISVRPWRPSWSTRRFPLVGNVVVFEPGGELVARREFDPAEDRYLLDHTLGRTVSRTDPGLFALALMPLAMSLEILAEAAACLVPGLTRDGHAGRARVPLALVGGGAADARAARTAPRRPTSGATAFTSSCRDGRGRRGGGEPGGRGGRPARRRLRGAAPRDRRGPQRGAAVALRRPGRLYDEAMFHGESWQAVRAVELSRPPVRSRGFEPLPRAGMLASDPEPGFVLDPVVLDAAGQVIGFWAADRLERGRVVFPFRLAALDVFGPPPVPGETLSCVASIALSGDALVRSDIDVLDPGGAPLDASDGLGGQALRRAGPLPGTHCARPRCRPCRPLGRGPSAPYSGEPVACRRLDARLPDRPRPVEAGLGEPRPRPPRTRALRRASGFPRSASSNGWAHARPPRRPSPTSCGPLTDSTCCPPRSRSCPERTARRWWTRPALERA